MLHMLQHSDEPNMDQMTEKTDFSVEVRTLQSLQAGDELLYQYYSGVGTKVPIDMFFLQYGFLPGNQKPIKELLTERSKLFFEQ